MPSGNGELIPAGGHFPTHNRKTGRELQRVTDRGIVRAYELDVEVGLYDRKQGHAEFATFKRIHTAGFLVAAAEAELAQNPRCAPLLVSALQDWDHGTSRAYLRTFS